MRQEVPNYLIHVLLVFLTLGFWLPVLCIIAFTKGEKLCTRCGTSVGGDVSFGKVFVIAATFFFFLFVILSLFSSPV